MKENSLLIIVDMVNGFIKEGVLSDIHINSITPNIIRLIQEHEGEIVFVRDSHDINCEEFKYYPVHCLKGSHESMLIDELKPYEGLGRTFLKNTTNIMNESDFIEYLNNNPEIKEFIITGCLTEVCVKNAVLSLLDYLEKNKRECSVIVPEDCVDTFDGVDHNREIVNRDTLNEFEKNNVKVLRKGK